MQRKNSVLVKIGNIELGEFPLLLAPMEDVSDPPFRALCKENGADVVYTEFISCEGLIRDAAKSVIKLDIYEKERPVGIQIFGANLDSMLQAVDIVEKSNPDIIDINFGCPVKKVVSKGAGAGILKDIDKMERLTKEIVKRTKLPVTVKTRLGWDHDSIKIIEVAERLQDVGCQAIAIHGRTRSQMYKGDADWSYIEQVKNNQRMHIPVFANGDIGQGPEDLIQVIDKEYQQSIENDESWGWDSYAFSVKVTPTEANRGNETGEWVLAEFWTDESNIIEWYQISEGKLISWNQFRRNRQ